MKNRIPAKFTALSLLALAAAPLAPAQEAATRADAKPAAPAAPAALPPIKVDPSPLAAGTPSFAPVVEKVSPSVVTIATSRIGRGRNSMSNNPLFNDPTFRRFFGIPDDPRGGGGSGPGNRGGREENSDDNENNSDGDSADNDAANPPGPNPGKKRSGPRQALGLGSGVIVSGEGHILTNNHVVEGADDIVVTIGNSTREYKAKKIGTDPGTDIAVLKIEGAASLPAVTFSDSDKVKPGDIVLAVGNPFGLTQSATMGVVSAVGRGGMGIIDFENFIQTDASINMGNSGGALVDYQGRLVGINTAIFSRTGGNQGIGFAVPANLARSVMESILKTGRVQRGFLGVALQPLNEDLSKAFKIDSDAGALISEVQPNSPAEKAGVQSGDVVVEVNKTKVQGPRELQLLVGGLSPGTSAELKLFRNGEEKLVKVDLGERPGKGAIAQTEPKETDPDVLDGVTVSDIDDDARKELELPATAKGVVITQIDPDSPSASSGLKRGDIIHEINREPVTTAKQAVDLSEKVKKETKVLLRVSSRGSSRYVVVERK